MLDDSIVAADLAECIVDLFECADEAKLAKNESEFHIGRLLVFNEALCIVKRAFEDYTTVKRLRDFDIDERYLRRARPRASS